MVDDHHGGRAPDMPHVGIVGRLQGLDLDRGERAPVRVVQPYDDVHGASFGLDAEQLVGPTGVVLNDPH